MASSDEQSDKECPLCVEPFEIDDINFYPCKCEYQICRFCWHRIRTDENGLCPGCRQPYPENPVNFKPLSSEELQRIKQEKKQKQQKERQKVSESRKHLANLRVLQKNLVYVIGLSPKVAEPETLKKSEYFGRYGKIIKVVVGTSVGQQQSSSSTAYVTYVRPEDALRAIMNINNVQLDGRTVKASLGTTKYCSSFLRNLTCHKPECMYLHDVAEDEASFTKEDMQQGKHTDYERRLMQSVLSAPSAGHTNNSSTSNNNNSNSSSSRKCGRSASPKARTQPVRHSTDDMYDIAQPKSSGRHGKQRPQSVHQTNSVEGISETPTEDWSPEPEPPHMTASSSAGVAAPAAPAPTSSEICESVRDTSSHESAGSASGAGGDRERLSESVSSQPQPVPVPVQNGHDTLLQAAFAQQHQQSVSMEMPGPPPGLSYPGTTDWQAVFGFASSPPQPTTSTGITSSSAAALMQSVLNGSAPTQQHNVAPAGLSALFASASVQAAAVCTSDTEDDLGFDPISESSKGLMDLLQQEEREAAERIKRERDLAPSSLFGSGQSSSSLFAAAWFSQQQPAAVCRAQTGSPHFSTPPPNHFGSTPPQYDLPVFTSARPHYNTTSSASDMPNVFNGVRMPPVRGPSPMMPPPPPGIRAPGLPPPGLRAPPGLGSLPPPVPPPGLSQPRSLSPISSMANGNHSGSAGKGDAGVLDLAEWQEGLKALLPNVNVHFAPGLQASSASSNGGGGGRQWRPTQSQAGSSVTQVANSQSQSINFNQPPPPLQMPPHSQNGIMPMRPSPPGRSPPEMGSSPFSRAIGPPPFRPPPPPPNMFAPNGPWSSVTPPPPPGFSPGSHRPLQ